MNKTIIRSVGKYLPKNIVTNNDLFKILGVDDNWIYKRCGIKERRWVNDGKRTSDLAYLSAKESIKKANWDVKEIDLIIFATQSPEYYLPGSGPILHEKLGLENTPTLDIRQQCTGFLYGLITSNAFIKSGIYC